MNDKCRVAIIVCLKDQMHKTIGYSLFKNLRLPTATGLDYEPFLVPIIFTEQAFRAKMTLAIQGKYNVVVVIGDFFSGVLAQMYKELEPIPTVFIGVSDPMKFGWVESLHKPGGAVSGVMVDTSDMYTDYVNKIALFSPSVSRILIPYNPDSFSGKVEVGALAGAEILSRAGITAMLKPARTTQELRSVVDHNITQVDAVWLLEGCTSVAMLRPVAYTCWEYKKILFASSSRDGIDSGAACSYGIDLTRYADEAAAMIRLHWEGRHSLALQSVKQLSNIRTLFLNESLLAQARVPQEVIDKLVAQEDVTSIKIWVNCPV